jgi:hypothetical protein
LKTESTKERKGKEWMRKLGMMAGKSSENKGGIKG